MTLPIVLAAAMGLSAQAPPPASISLPPLGQETREASASRPRRRASKQVIQLKDGGIVRGLTRSTDDGGFEVKRQGGWISIAAERVDKVTAESKLVRELRRRQADGSLSPADQVEWALESGLLREAFQLGDELVPLHHRDLDLRSVCARGSRLMGGIPERGADGELDAIRRIGAAAGPMVREGLMERVVTAAPRAVLLETFTRDLQSTLPGRRSFALLCLGRLFPKEDPRAVLLHAMYDRSGSVRSAAARAVGDIGPAAVGEPLIKGLYASSAEVRTRAAEALGRAGNPEYVEPLMDRLFMLAAAPRGGSVGRPPHAYIFVGTQSAYIQDFDVEVARGSSVADPVINTLTSGSVLDVGVLNTSEVTIVSESRAVRGALERIVGQAPGRRMSDWKRWWSSDASARYRGLGRTEGPETPGR